MILFPPNSNIPVCSRVKFGIDPTFHRLHLGHMVPLRIVKNMIERGHSVTIVLGTFTAQLGDPSGVDKTRPILSECETAKNAVLIKSQLISFFGPLFSKIRFFENHTLHNETKLPDFLRTVSRFSVSHMLNRDGFVRRQENGQQIGLHELLVPICQGMDSVHLNSEIEIGGQDQLFNFQITRQLQEQNGITPQVCILTSIISGTDGRKMSKSLRNCIFMDDEPNDIFGKVMSVSDDVMKEWFTSLSNSEQLNNPLDNKKLLAFDIVKQLHGETTAHIAKESFESTIQKKNVPENILVVFASNIIDALIQIDGITSKTQARTLIDSKSVSIDGSVVTDHNTQVFAGQIIKKGKRHFIRIG